jgi:hypothetical protein
MANVEMTGPLAPLEGGLEHVKRYLVPLDASATPDWRTAFLRAFAETNVSSRPSGLAQVNETDDQQLAIQVDPTLAAMDEVGVYIENFVASVNLMLP